MERLAGQTFIISKRKSSAYCNKLINLKKITQNIMAKIVTGDTEFFKGIGQIKFEGQGSDNPLAFRWYDADKVVAGKTMKDHLRFAGAYWHSFVGNGADPFGEPTHLFPWAV